MKMLTWKGFHWPKVGYFEHCTEYGWRVLHRKSMRPWCCWTNLATFGGGWSTNSILWKLLTREMKCLSCCHPAGGVTGSGHHHFATSDCSCATRSLRSCWERFAGWLAVATSRASDASIPDTGAARRVPRAGVAGGLRPWAQWHLSLITPGTMSTQELEGQVKQHTTNPECRKLYEPSDFFSTIKVQRETASGT